jgi:hypothetical protein
MQETPRVRKKAPSLVIPVLLAMGLMAGAMIVLLPLAALISAVSALKNQTSRGGVTNG